LRSASLGEAGETLTACIALAGRFDTGVSLRPRFSGSFHCRLNAA